MGQKTKDNESKINEYMLHEYDTLRKEILNTYAEQTRLVFATAIMPAILLFARLNDVLDLVSILPVLLIIVIGIAFKSIANYSRIYRIGTYIAVVHEEGRQGLPQPSPLNASWHSSWRRVKEKEKLWGVGNDGPWAESAFLLFVSMIGWLLAIKEYDFQNGNILYFIEHHLFSAILSIILFYTLFVLATVFIRNKKYKKYFQTDLKL